MKKRIVVAVLAAGLLLGLLGGCSLFAHEVRFEPNGGTKVSGTLLQEVETGESAEPPVVERDGYVFTGWDGDYTDVKKDLVLAAEWTKGYTVTFDAAGGEIVSGREEQVVAEGSVPKPPRVERADAEFLGWEPELAAVDGDTSYTALWAGGEYSSEEIFDLISPCVVELSTYDADGNGLSIGSGFFIDDTGTIVTNYHVIEGAFYIDATLSDGGTYPVTTVSGYDKELDLAVLQCGRRDTPHITISSRDTKTGEKVYALGSSLGLTGTFSDGIVSTASRDVDGVNCVQTTAPISHGNSGGPLVNVYGEVIGINSMTFTEGQNINFSIHINELENLDLSEPKTVEEFYDVTDGASYSGGNAEDDPETIYDQADYREAEPNDNDVLADAMQNGPWCAGQLDQEDLDVFSITVDDACDVDLYMVPFYTVDNDWILAALTDSEFNVLSDADGAAIGYLEALANDDGQVFQATTLHLDQAGTYYFVLTLLDDYPYSDDAYYEISVDWY